MKLSKAYSPVKAQTPLKASTNPGSVPFTFPLRNPVFNVVRVKVGALLAKCFQERCTWFPTAAEKTHHEVTWVAVAEPVNARAN